MDYNYYLFTTGRGGVIVDNEEDAKYFCSTLSQKARCFGYNDLWKAQRALNEHMIGLTPVGADFDLTFPLDTFVTVGELLDFIGYKGPLPDVNIFTSGKQ